MTFWHLIAVSWQLWLVVLLVMFALTWLIRTASGANRWYWRDRNPYRRYCKLCGTGQSLWVGTGCPQDGKWEYFLPIHPCKYRHEDEQ